MKRLTVVSNSSYKSFSVTRKAALGLWVAFLSLLPINVVPAAESGERYLAADTFLCKSIDGIQHRLAGAPAPDCISVNKFEKVIKIRSNDMLIEGKPETVIVVSYNNEDWLAQQFCGDQKGKLNSRFFDGGACLIERSNDDQIKKGVFSVIMSDIEISSHNYNRDWKSNETKGAVIPQAIPYCSKYKGNLSISKWVCDHDYNIELNKLKDSIKDLKMYIEEAKTLPGDAGDDESKADAAIQELQRSYDADAKLLGRYRGPGKPLSPETSQ